MTTIVVDPKDIREDSEQALKGLENQRGERMSKAADEIYDDDDNNSFTWFGLVRSHKIHSRRDIGLALQDYLNDKAYGQAELSGLGADMAIVSYHSWIHHTYEPVKHLINAAHSLNALELHVESRTLRKFEAAYDAGAKPSDTEE